MLELWVMYAATGPQKPPSEHIKDAALRGRLPAELFEEIQGTRALFGRQIEAAWLIDLDRPFKDVVKICYHRDRIPGDLLEVDGAFGRMTRDTKRHVWDEE
jgi:hypothetical protein